MDPLQREYSAREFNRDPSVIARAARRLGSVRITNRGALSLIVVDATRHPELARLDESPSVLDSLSLAAEWDEDVLGEPERARVNLRDGEGA